jgi:chromosome segregation ATPase
MATTAEAEAPDSVVELAGKFDAQTRDLLAELTSAECHTTQLREATGMSRQQVHNRLEDLEERDVVATEIRKPDAGGQKRRHARLTEYGEGLIDDGLLDKIHDTNVNVEALRQKLSHVQTELRRELRAKPEPEDIDWRAESIANREMEPLERDLEDLTAHVENLEKGLGQLRAEVSENDEDLRDLVGQLQADATEAAAGVDRLARRADDLDARLGELEEGRRADRLDAVVAHLAELFDRVDDLEDDTDSAIGKAASAKRTAKTLDDDLREEMEEHRGVINSNASKQQRSLGKFDRRLSRLEDALADATDLDESIAGFEERLDKMRSDWLDLHEKIQEERSGGWF